MKSSLVILTGGGTGGSVSPLLAVAERLAERDFDLAWIGTRGGVEEEMVAGAKIAYHGITAGKWRRYFSLANLIDPFKIAVGFFQALALLMKLKPRVVVTAGGFVSVPVVWAAWALHVKILVHQQDLRPGLANRLMAPLADIVTVTFEKSLSDYGAKAVLTGNPIRREFREAAASEAPASAVPRILVLGGGTGSQALNALVRDSLPALRSIAAVSHVTGKNLFEGVTEAENYKPYPFVDVATMAKEMKEADIVVTRAGLGTLTELSYLGKPTLIIPMPASHQEDNAHYFEEHGAAIVMRQAELDAVSFVKVLRELLAGGDKLHGLSERIRAIMKQGADERLAELVSKLD